jgi:hypothetical protein
MGFIRYFDLAQLRQLGASLQILSQSLGGGARGPFSRREASSYLKQNRSAETMSARC